MSDDKTEFMNVIKMLFCGNPKRIYVLNPFEKGIWCQSTLVPILNRFKDKIERFCATYLHSARHKNVKRGKSIEMFSIYWNAGV